MMIAPAMTRRKMTCGTLSRGRERKTFDSNNFLAIGVILAASGAGRKTGDGKRMGENITLIGQIFADKRSGVLISKYSVGLADFAFIWLSTFLLRGPVYSAGRVSYTVIAPPSPIINSEFCSPYVRRRDCAGGNGQEYHS